MSETKQLMKYISFFLLMHFTNVGQYMIKFQGPWQRIFTKDEVFFSASKNGSLDASSHCEIYLLKLQS